MKHAGVMAMAATVVTMTCASPAATDVCLSRFCTKDNEATCDRKFEKCPVCMSFSDGGKTVRCTAPTFSFCSVLGIGDQKCDKPWTDPDDPEEPPVETTDAPTTTAKPSKTTLSPTTSKVTNTTSLAPTTTKATAKPTPTTTPVATSALENTTTQPVTTPDSGTGTGWIMYAGIGVGAAIVIGVVALLVLRMTRQNEEDDDDEESYKQPTTTAQSTQYNPYSNNPPPPTTESSAAVASLPVKLDHPTSDRSTANLGAAAVVVEGTRQKSVHTDVWGNVPSSFREGEVASYSGNDSFLSDGSLRRTGNSVNGDVKPRDNETRLSVEF